MVANKSLLAPYKVLQWETGHRATVTKSQNINMREAREKEGLLGLGGEEGNKMCNATINRMHASSFFTFFSGALLRLFSFSTLSELRGGNARDKKSLKGSEKG